jgi:hypothetical protein
MRWGLTKKNRVAPVSDLIRRCSPRSVREWQDYSYENVHPAEYLEELGPRLYVKVTEVCRAEIDDVTEEDCIGFIKSIVIQRTFDGYQSKIQTIYGQLQEALGITIKRAPKRVGRGYNVDFFIRVKAKFIGLQVKPAGYAYIPQTIKELQFQKATHEEFTAKYGGKVFYIISMTEGKKKVIHYPEVIDEVKKEINRLKTGSSDLTMPLGRQNHQGK